MHRFLEKLASSVKTSFMPSTKTTLWLLKIMLPISLIVTVAQHFGVIDVVAAWLEPAMRLFGLPGRAAIGFLTGAFVTTYAGIAAMLQLALTMREATIVGIMICICHALFVESAVNRKVGSSFWRMFIIRFGMAFVCAFYLNIVLPDSMHGTFGEGITMDSDAHNYLLSWALSSVKMSVMIWLLIWALMIIQRLAEAFGLMQKLVRPLHPLMRLCGLPESTAYMWIVGNVLGISYGSAVMLDLEERGQISKDDANDVNYHLIMNHSLLEDTFVFASMGIPALWIASTRFLFALIVVWGRKAVIALRAMP
jgi:hypothetical protein